MIDSGRVHLAPWRGDLIRVNAKGEYVCPNSFTPDEWRMLGYLRSFGLYANFGHAYWDGPTIRFGRRFKVCLLRLAVRLMPPASTGRK